MEEKTEVTRLRFGFKPTAKGTINLDVTAEAETPGKAKQLLIEGIAIFKDVAKAEKLELTGVAKS